MGNKSREIECLEKVFKTKNKCRGKVKEFLNKLSNMKRIDSERPDFIFTDKNGLVIGLEHFLVDQFSQRNKNGKIASNGVIGRKNIKDFIDSNVGCYSEDNSIEIMNEFNQRIIQRVKNHMEATYSTFMAAFEYSLNNHTKACASYKENVKLTETTNKTSYLGLLIEIKADFCHLYLNNERGIKKVPLGFVPLFSEMVEILENKTYGICDFVILSFGEELYKNSDRIYIVRTGHIKEDLEKQRGRIYEYAVEDCLLESFQSMQKDVQIRQNVSSEGNQITCNFEASMYLIEEQQMLAFVWHAFYRAFYAKQNKRNYVCSFLVLYCMEVYLKYVIKWLRKKESWEVKPIFRPVPVEQLEKEGQEFFNTWDVEK